MSFVERLSFKTFIGRYTSNEAIVAEEQAALATTDPSAFTAEQVARLRYLSERLKFVSIVLAHIGFDCDSEQERRDVIQDLYDRTNHALNSRGQTSPHDQNAVEITILTEILTHEISMLGLDPTNEFIAKAIMFLQGALERRQHIVPHQQRREEQDRAKRVYAIKAIRITVDYNDIPEDERDICNICYRTIDGFKMVKLPDCAPVPHFFCRQCLTTHLLTKTNCPTCRVEYRGHLEQLEQYWPRGRFHEHENEEDEDEDETE